MTNLVYRGRYKVLPHVDEVGSISVVSLITNTLMKMKASETNSLKRRRYWKKGPGEKLKAVESLMNSSNSYPVPTQRNLTPKKASNSN